MKKLDEKEVSEYFINHGGYKFIPPYKSFFDKILIEKDGYKCEISYGHFKDGNSPNFFGERCKYQLDNIKLFVFRKNPNVNVISCRNIRKSGKFRILVKIKCSCGKIFERTWDNIYNLKNIMCPECLHMDGAKQRKVRYNDKYKRDIIQRGYSLIDNKENLYANRYVEVVQIATGYRGFIYPNTNSEMLVFNLPINKKNFVYNMNIYNKNNGNQSEVLELIEDANYKNYEVKVRCECGEIFNTNYRSYLKGKIYCDKCAQSISKYERIVKEFLDDNDIKYIYQFQINSCKDKKPLPFDFQLCDYNILIEIDGEQHFYPVRFGEISEELANKKFESCQKRDKIKTDYCIKYNIPMLRISYKEILDNTYQKKILSFIQQTA